MLSQSRHAIVTAFTGTMLTLASLAAQAQKPALVQNIDEKGRVPYSDVSPGALCGSGICHVTLKPVPVGYRLVITQVSVLYIASVSGNDNWIFLLNDSTPTTPPGSTHTPNLVLPAVYSGSDGSGGSVFIVSTPVTYYVDPGMAPGLQINNGNGSSPNVAIFGYIVALNN